MKLSKLEYMLAIAYHLGANVDKDELDFDLSFVGVEHLTTICGVILDEFYTQNEVSHINDFLYDLDARALNEIYARVA